MKRITFTARYPPELVHPMHERLMTAAGVSRAELLLWGPTDAVTTLCWYDGTPADVRGVLDAVESVASASLVTAETGTYAFVRQRRFEFADPLLDVVADAAVVFVPPVTFEEFGVVEFEAVGDAAGLRAFYDELDALADVSIERVREFGRARTPSDLTARQRAALSAALDVGYYEIPRTGTVQDVADELDCAHSTAGELLRKAEAAVVAAHVRPR